MYAFYWQCSQSLSASLILHLKKKELGIQKEKYLDNYIIKQ